MSSIESAPATIPATTEATFRCALTPPGLAQLHMLGDEPLQTGPLGQLKDRRQASARHQVRVIEDGRQAVTDSHPADALLVR